MNLNKPYLKNNLHLSYIRVGTLVEFQCNFVDKNKQRDHLFHGKYCRDHKGMVDKVEFLVVHELKKENRIKFMEFSEGYIQNIRNFITH